MVGKSMLNTALKAGVRTSIPKKMPVKVTTNDLIWWPSLVVAKNDLIFLSDFWSMFIKVRLIKIKMGQIQ